jgi:hypothetical protein
MDVPTVLAEMRRYNRAAPALVDDGIVCLFQGLINARRYLDGGHKPIRVVQVEVVFTLALR